MSSGIEWGTLAQWLSPMVALSIAIWAAVSKRDETALNGLKEDIADLRDNDERIFTRLDKQESDVAAVKVEIKHLPTRDELHRIDVKVSQLDVKIDARFDAITEKIDTVIAQNERAQDRLAEREDRDLRGEGLRR